MNTRSHGCVRIIDHARGFCFVECDESGYRYFAHVTAFRGRASRFAGVDIGTRVTFIPTQVERGDRRRGRRGRAQR